MKRLLLIGGLIAILSADNCGVFSNVLQTRKDPSSIDVNPGQIAYIHNTSSCVLNTGSVYKDNSGHGLKCDNGEFAVASGKYGNGLNVNYSFTVKDSNATLNPSSSTQNIIIKNYNTILTGDSYNSITQDYHHYDFVLSPNNNILSVNKIYNILNNVTISNIDNKTIKIGEFSTATYSKTNLFLKGVPKAIEIYKIYSSGSNLFNTELNATDYIDINTLQIGRYNSKVVLRAPNVTIENLIQSNSGSGDSNIIIYADTVNIKNISLNQDAKLYIYPYTKGGSVKFYSNSISSSSSSTIYVSSGDYYTNSFSIPGTSSSSSIRAIDNNQIVNLYINGDFKPGNNPGINSDGNDGNFGNLDPSNFRIYINGDLDTGGGGTTFNALIYVEGDANLGSPTYIKGALSSNGNITIGNNSQFYWYSSVDSAQFNNCANSGSSSNSIPLLGGAFNVVEPSFNSLIDPIDENNSLNWIHTKVVNKSFKMKVLKLGDDKESLENFTGLVRVDIIKAPSNDNECLSNSAIVSKYVYFDNTSNVDVNISSNKVLKDAKFRVVYLSDGVGGVIQDSDKACMNGRTYNCAWGLLTQISTSRYGNACPASDSDYCDVPCAKECDYKNLQARNEGESNIIVSDSCMQCIFANYGEASCSRDDFAIRPYGFLVFSKNQYKRAGEDFNITIKAVDESNYSKTSGTINDVKGAIDYNESLSNLKFDSIFYTPTEDEIIQMNKDLYGVAENNVSKVAYCPDKGVFNIVTNRDFKNGEVNATLNYSETGVLTLKVSEVNGSEFAKVDEKDTNDSLRLIKPATFVLDKDDISKKVLMEFIPYKFITKVDYNSTTGANWVYMNDLKYYDLNHITPNMAAFIEYNVTAYNKNGDIVKNFTKSCFADSTINAPVVGGLKLNTTFDVNIDTKFVSSHDRNVTFYMESNGNYVPLSIKEATLSSNSLIKENLYSTLFNNGSSVVKLYFNIDRNYNTPLIDTNISLTEANVSTSLDVVCEGSKLNKTIKFLYGRVVINSASGEGKEVNTTALYKYWSKDGWIVNKLHNSSIYGDIKDYLPKTITLLKKAIKNGEEELIFTTNHALPYSVRVHFSIPSYLWYHPLASTYLDPSMTDLNCLTHPCANINFTDSSKGWGGIGKSGVKYSETNRTSEINSTKNVIQINKRGVIKIDW